MKSSVIVFPGSNCDRDIAVALEKLQFKNQMVWHKETELPKSDLIVLPGGFSYGDYLRSGAIAGKSLIIDEVIKAANDGCLVLGRNSHQSICQTYGNPGIACILGTQVVQTPRKDAPPSKVYKFSHLTGMILYRCWFP